MSAYTPIKELKVGIDLPGEIWPVGRLAERNRKLYFEYDATFVSRGLELSPFRLPLSPGLKTFEPQPFEGLPGLFDDSLPDGWGRLLFDRMLRTNGILSGEITPLDRLAHVGATGMGALVYEPDHSPDEAVAEINLDVLASQAQDVLNGSAEDVIQELLALNGSSAGARPKAMIGVDSNAQRLMHGTFDLPPGYSHWMVKFPNTQDGRDAGAIEYVYGLMAQEAGIAMPPIHLFPARGGPGYFGVERFDRKHGKRLHMHSAGGLLHADFRAPALDYEDLLALTGALARDVREVEKMFRLAVFNVLAYNRDDHAKNFAFLMDSSGEWKLSPAFDLTFSSGPRDEQSTMVLGEGRLPGAAHLRALGEQAKLSSSVIDSAIERTQQALAQWKSLARKYDVTTANIELIDQRLKSVS